MFGLLSGRGCLREAAMRQAWMGQICAVCVGLGRAHGPAARLATNYDAALLAALYAAQAETEPPVQRHYCPLRRGGSATIAADTPGARYAGALALMMAATRLRDNLADSEGWPQRLPVVATRLAARWEGQAHRTAAALGFPSNRLAAQIQRQAQCENTTTAGFDDYAAPTEQAVGAAFAYTATLAGQPANCAPLEQAGRMYGRVMYLLDSYRDYHADQAQQRFNALARCFDPPAVQAQARRCFLAAHAALSQSCQALILPRPALVQLLLLQQVRQTGLRILAASVADDPAAQPDPAGQRRTRRGRKAGRQESDSSDWDCCDGCDCSLCAWRLPAFSGSRRSNDNDGCGCCGDGCCGCDSCRCNCCGCGDGDGCGCSCGSD